MPFNSTPLGKRLRKEEARSDDKGAGGEIDHQALAQLPPDYRPSTPTRTTPSLDFSGETPPSPTTAVGSKRKRDPRDRFVPHREGGETRSGYNLMMDGGPSSPTKTSKIIPCESDALKEQANSAFTHVLGSEFSPHHHRSTSPVRPGPVAIPVTPTTPTRNRRLFDYSSPAALANTPATPSRSGLDASGSRAYAPSPIRPESSNFLQSPQKQLRTVCKTPFRVLDAPDLTDDFYLNLVDWSSTNVLGVGLGHSVYLWTAHTAQVTKLCQLASGDFVTSLNWIDKGNLIAVGSLSGKVLIWDAVACTLVRTLEGHGGRVGALAWHDQVITSGSRDRAIFNRDIRVGDPTPVRRFLHHRQEICGLRWNTNTGGGQSLLASGGNDNKLLLWSLHGASTEPIMKYHDHSAAVKAIAWSPHQVGLLASGGGTQDKKMKFWNTNSTSTVPVNELDTGSQVCNLIWSRTSQEIVSTHGYSSTHGQNQICIWKYPSLDMVATLGGHTHRVLYLAMSPDGQTIVTGAGDETLRFWNAFPKAKEVGKRQETSSLDLHQQIR